MPFEYSPVCPDAVDSERVIFVYNDGYHGEYGHINAIVLRRAKSFKYNEDGTLKEYNDGKNAIGFRNTDWTAKKKSALYCADFNLTAQYNRFDSNQPYVAKFGELYAVKLKVGADNLTATKSKNIGRTLERLEKNLNGEIGIYSNYAETLMVLAETLGIKTIITKDESCSVYGGMILNSNNFKEFSLDQIEFVLKKFAV